MFEAKASNKLEWIKQRLIEIYLGIENIAMWDNIQSEFQERVHEYPKRFRCTNFGAFLRFSLKIAKFSQKLNSFLKKNQANLNITENISLFKRRS